MRTFVEMACAMVARTIWSFPRQVWKRCHCCKVGLGECRFCPGQELEFRRVELVPRAFRALLDVKREALSQLRVSL